jgi:hypothetical protein
MVIPLSTKVDELLPVTVKAPVELPRLRVLPAAVAMELLPVTLKPPVPWIWPVPELTPTAVTAPPAVTLKLVPVMA